MAYTKEMRDAKQQLNQNQQTMATKNDAGASKKHLNEGIDLSGFDYSAMRGQMYENYLQLVEGKIVDEDDPRQIRAGGLNGHQKYVFEVWNVKPKTKRLYPKSQIDTTKVPDGFELVSNKPYMVTTTFLKDAIGLNAALYANIGGANNNPIYYYLLQKPTSNV